MPELKLELLAGDKDSMNGRIERRVAIAIDGQQRAIQRITLDSRKSIGDAVKQWGRDYGIDEGVCRKELDQLGVLATAEAQRERDRKNAARGTASGHHVVQLTQEWLQSLGLEWHRQAKSIYCGDEAIRREVQLGDLWKLAPTAIIDGVQDTVEGCDLFTSTDFRKRLSLFRDAVQLAVAKLIRTLPEVNDAERDKTVDPETLKAAVTIWLLKPRLFRTDTGTPITKSYFNWALGVAPGEPWQRCFEDPVFARMEAGGRFGIGVKGEFLLPEVRGYQSWRRLLADLIHNGVVSESKPVKVALRNWRLWLLTPDFLDSISTPETEMRNP